MADDGRFISRAALVVVDCSVEQYREVSFRPAATLEAIRALCTRDHLWAMKVDSRLWLRDQTESTLSLPYPEYGLTRGVPGTPGAALVSALEGSGLAFVPKKHYSCFAGKPSTLDEALKARHVDTVVFAGINTEYCVLISAVEAFAMGYRVFVAADAVTSVSGEAGHALGINLLETLLPAGAVLPSEAIDAALSRPPPTRPLGSTLTRGTQTGTEQELSSAVPPPLDY